MSKHNLHVAAPIPSHITPAEVIEALHDHNTCLTLQALTTGHTKLPDVNPETRKDTYWYPPDIHPISTYEVTECVTLVPGIGEWGKKYITFPSCFQDTPHGIKTRADAPAVVLRAEFRVIKGSMDDGEVEGEGQGVGYAEYVLVEDVEVICAWYMMPFVRKSMEAAHQDICKKVVEKVEMRKRQEAVARRAAKGKERVEEELVRRASESPTVSRSGTETGLGIEDAEVEVTPPDKITYG